MVDGFRAHFATKALLTAFLATLVACAGPETRPTGPPLTRLAEVGSLPGGEVLTASVDLPELRAILADSAADELTATYLAAEIDLLEGQYNRAFTRFGEVVSAQPNTVLGAMAAGRLVERREGIVDFVDRVRTLADSLTGTRLNPLTVRF